jgi:small subunit ribosomal protein S7
MPRRKKVVPREVAPDPVFGSSLASRFINSMMKDGKKSIAEKIFYGAMDIIKEKTGDDPLKALTQAFDNVKPRLEVKSRRVGGATYQVPVEVKPRRQSSLSVRWIVNAANSRSEKMMKEKLAFELLDAANHRGVAIKKKEDTHRMAEANRAFAHYRW